MTKPLIRWTIGRTTYRGFLCLKESLRKLREIYAERFDFIVCYNEVSNYILSLLQSLQVPLHAQTACSELEYLPRITAWKLYPPRLRPDSHEIFIDNDIVILERLPEIEQFLETDSVLLYEGLHGLHGQYEVPAGYKINSGIFGIPPKYDFAQEIRKTQATDRVRGWTSWFDEQGCVAATLLKFPERYLVSQKQIPCCEPDQFLPTSSLGYHFVGINRSAQHQGWTEYQLSKLCCL